MVSSRTIALMRFAKFLVVQFIFLKRPKLTRMTRNVLIMIRKILMIRKIPIKTRHADGNVIL